MTIQVAYRRKISLPLSLLLVIAMLITSFAVSIPTSFAADANINIFMDFENYNLGPLQGQNGWSADSKTTVTSGVSVSGTRSIRIQDDDNTKAFGPIYNFTPITQGKIEWWARTDTKSRLIAQIQSYSSSGTLTAEWMGFYSNGKFAYYDGTTRKDSDVTYELNKWYRFTVLFDSAAQTKTIIISDENGPIFLKSGIGFRDAGITTLNRLRFSTISTDTGIFNVDDIRIRNQVEDDLSQLNGLMLMKNEYSLTAGQTANLQVLGSFADGGINIVNKNNTFLSSRPDVASVDAEGKISAVSSGEASISVTNSVYSASANVIVYGPGDIPPYKAIAPRVLQRETDLSSLIIITPPDEGWKQAGEQLASKLKEKWNINASVTVSDPEQVGDGWTGNVLVLGNLGNNPHIARLYGLYLSYTDAVHPGKGGYQLQTLVNPFGKGGNTLLLGASDLAGLNEGVNHLNSILDSLAEPVLPWQSESKLSDEAASALPYGKTPTDSDIQQMLAEADALIAQLNPNSTDELDANYTISLLSKVMYHGKLYQITNDEGYGKVYRYYLKAYAAFLNRYPQVAQTHLISSRNMWTSGYAAIAAYNVMEASPIFDSLDRKQIVSAMYLTYDANTRDGYLSKAPETGARYNHDVFPALSIIFGSSYFLKYYNFPEVQNWYRLGERMFKGNTSNINLDEGSDYLMHVPAVTLEYAMATGDNRFLAKGLRPAADLYAMMIDNLGTMSGGGDVYPFGSSSAYSWNHSQVLNAASWFFGEPLYQFLLERTKTGPFDGQDMSDLSFPFHRYRTDKAVATELNGEYPMVQSYPVEQGVYDELKKDDPGEPLDVPVEETFHKLSFREGFDVDDSYLMLDGFSAGKHGHMDGNTILKYSANGRIFIDDRDYIEKAPKNHTGMLVMKDGVQEAKPPLTRLIWAADADGIGISRSETPNYNGTDWVRSIISPGGRFFIIYDDVNIKEDGRYILENTWQTLGDLDINGDQYNVEQQGVNMSLQSLDESDLRQYERYGHYIKYWETVYPYPYADEEHVLREVKDEQAYNAGDTSRFINVLSSSQGNSEEVKARRLNNETVRIEEGGREWYIYWGALSSENFESNGKFHLVGDDEILAAETTNVRIGSESLQFEQPVFFKLKPSDGSWEAFRLKKGMTNYDENGSPIQDGTVESGNIAQADKLVIELKQALQRQQNPTEWKKPETDHATPMSSWSKVSDFGEEVTSSAVGDINGDGTEELILGGISGKIQVIDEHGRTLWTFQSRGRVNEVTVQQVEGEPVIFVATENWYVHVIDRSGIEKWSVEIPNTSERRERKGNLIGVTNIRVAHVNGQDQDPWIMVGTQFRYLYGFDLQGNLKYEDIAYFYGIEDMEYLDLDSDGKDEGFLALEYYYYSIWNEGTLTRYGGTKEPGPGFKAVELLDTWSGNTKPAAFYGTKQNQVHLIQYSGKPSELWKCNVGGEVNDLLAGDFDADGKTEFLAASDGFQLYCLNDDGSVRWKTTLGDRVMKVTAVQTAEGVHYMAAVDNGGVYTLNAQGEIVSREVFAELVQEIHPGTKQGSAWIVLENGQVYRDK